MRCSGGEGGTACAVQSLLSRDHRQPATTKVFHDLKPVLPFQEMITFTFNLEIMLASASSLALF